MLLSFVLVVVDDVLPIFQKLMNPSVF